MDYTRALEQAVMYIENHLLEDIRVEDVARNTGYSYYHLTRQFSAMLGESVGSYIKKRRLADAAKQLLYTDRRIIDIALERGFESSEAFSRSFKALYRVSPALYRKNRLDLFIGSKPRLDAGGRLEHLTQNVTVHPSIVELPDIKVIASGGKPPYMITCCRIYGPGLTRFPIPSTMPQLMPEGLASVKPVKKETRCFI